MVASQLQDSRLLSIDNMNRQSSTILNENDSMLKSVAHDLRNPIAGISSIVDLMFENGQLLPEQQELLFLIKDAAKYSLNLVQQILTSDGPKKGLPALERVDLHSLILKSIRLAKHQVQLKSQTLKINLFQEKVLITIDKDNIIRVIDNLIGNAIKFTPSGGQIVVSTRPLSDGIQIIVRDNGIGIAEELQHKIFDGGTECRQKGTLGEESHGMGLCICKRIIEGYGGTLTFQSRPDKGTVFYVWLPV